ncbi:MAG: HepT-like ribonuclease domain-containing protein [Ktedonobacteraceae bacterium]
MRNTTEYLRVIQEAVSRILKYASKGQGLFDQDELVQTWIIHHFEIIGEAINSLPQMFRSLHPEIQWKKYIDMRDALTYHYYEVNQDRIWAMVENDILSLKASVDAILAEQE